MVGTVLVSCAEAVALEQQELRQGPLPRSSKPPPTPAIASAAFTKAYLASAKKRCGITSLFLRIMYRVGQLLINTPYMTVCSVISLPKIRIYLHRILLVLADPSNVQKFSAVPILIGRLSPPAIA